MASSTSSALSISGSRRGGLARQACDHCRTRKAKCDADNTLHCRRCSKLGLHCTFLLPQGIRGPRKKNNSASQHLSPTASSSAISGFLQSPELLQNHGITSPVQWTMSPQTPNDQTSPDMFDSQSFPTDGLFPRDLLHRMLHDYLEYLYPLIPVVHRPTFLHGLAKNRDVYNKDFLALVVSLCAVTVGTMPRRFREYRSCNPPLFFETRTDMMRHCYIFIVGLRGADYFEQINFQKWAASYLMAIAFFQIGEPNQARMIEVESMQLARLLGLHQISEYKGLNFIETQLRKKAFWLMFYGYVHSQLQNLRKERLTYLDASILSTLHLEDLVPLEVDDESILEDTILPQSQSGIGLPITRGFVIHSRLFWAALTSSAPLGSPGATREPCNCVRSTQPLAQLAYLKDRLRNLKYMLDSIPPQLRQWPAGGDETTLYSPDPDQRRILKAQFASMRANLHVTHLWLQSIILDQMDALLSGEMAQAQDLTLAWAEREDISRQLLHVLHGIEEVYLEPNGHHLTYKVRDVAVTLLTCPFEPDEEPARRASEYLRDFANKLSRIDGSEIMNTLSLQSWVDTDRGEGKST